MYDNQINNQQNPLAPVQDPLSQPYPNVSKPRSKKTLIIIIAASATIIILLTIVLINLLNNNSNYILYDASILPETLTSQMAAAVANNEYKDYETTISTTAYLQYSTGQICLMIGAPCRSLGSPADRSNLKKVPALNSNALDYYLDQDNIVIMQTGETPLTMLIIYARNNSLYSVFNPADPEYLLYSTRMDIFNSLVEVPTFYTFKPNIKLGEQTI